MTRGSIRLANLPVGGKVTLTAFVTLVGVGYLVAVCNIYEHHQNADLEPGLGLDDLRRVYHGIEKEVTAEPAERFVSLMEQMVSPGEMMRRQLEKGGEPAVRALFAWLQTGAKQEDFAREGVSQPGDPSAKQVIAERCIRCHNSTDGEMAERPYAVSADAEPQYALVGKVAAPPDPEQKIVHLAPTSREKLVQITHAHMLSIPVFALLVAVMFLLTGLPTTFKTVLAPLPMLAICADFAAWWLARPMESFVYLILAAGGVFGAAFGAQIICVLGSTWFGRRT